MSAGPLSATQSYDQLTVPSFDRVAVEVLAGSGLVARTPGAVLVLAHPDGEGQWRAAEALIAQVAETSREAPRAPGTALTQVVTAWHEAQPTVGLALLAATDDGLALCLSGAAEAGLPSTGHRLTAQAEGGWLSRQLAWTDAAIVIALGPVGTAGRVGTGGHAGGIEAPRERTALDLHAGVVPGAGARLASPAVETGPAAPDLVHRLDRLPPPPPPAAAEVPVAAAPLDLPPQAKAANLFGADIAEPVRAPLPVSAPPARGPGHPHDHQPFGSQQPAAATAGPGSAAPPAASSADAAAAVEDGVVVDGFLCSRGHLNDPRGHFCAQCGIRMAELTGIISKGRRPPLGLLLFDNGATFVLDHDYLIGREPETDPQVQAGVLRPLVLLDQGGGISRQHAEVRLQGWDVVLIDRGSANGTLVALRDAAQWRAVVPGQPIRLLPGMRMSMGRRTVSFETPHRTT